MWQHLIKDSSLASSPLQLAWVRKGLREVPSSTPPPSMALLYSRDLSLVGQSSPCPSGHASTSQPGLCFPRKTGRISSLHWKQKPEHKVFGDKDVQSCCPLKWKKMRKTYSWSFVSVSSTTADSTNHKLKILEKSINVVTDSTV